MTPAALIKAESLARYAKARGSPLRDFALAVTLGEAYELLDYLVEQHSGNALLRHDVNEAKADGNPFAVLAHFQLLGFEIVPVSELH